MPRRRPEQQIQKALADHLRLRVCKDVFWFACENGGYRTAVESAILKACGIRSGVPDVILIRGGKVFGKAPRAELARRRHRRTRK